MHGSNSEAHALASAELLKEPKNKRYIEPESVLDISSKVLTRGRSARVEMVECLTLTWPLPSKRFTVNAVLPTNKNFFFLAHNHPEIM